MLFLSSQDTGIAATLSHPLREVFALAARIAINLLLGLEMNYPHEQVMAKIMTSYAPIISALTLD